MQICCQVAAMCRTSHSPRARSGEHRSGIDLIGRSMPRNPLACTPADFSPEQKLMSLLTRAHMGIYGPLRSARCRKGEAVYDRRESSPMPAR